MKYDIKATTGFLRELKRLSKRYKSIYDDVMNLGESLKDNPRQGVDLGKGLRKVRMPITSKGRGKSGGARVITYDIVVSEYESTILLLAIYDKSDRENLSDKEIVDIMKRSGLL